MLHLFGHLVQQCATLSNNVGFNNVGSVWLGLKVGQGWENSPEEEKGVVDRPETLPERSTFSSLEVHRAQRSWDFMISSKENGREHCYLGI